ncbi:TRAP transporter small permease [Jiella sp. M17.18]|uniref:TRAP transporter small permease n=1 Tax=Jiella sp. M17.18 TaxID=3234247 RepID=UPI0034DEE578
MAHAPVHPSPRRPERRRGLAAVAGAGDRLAGAVGHIGMVALLALTAGIILGIVLRWVRIDNSWTYDLDLFALVWVAFAGAVMTARFDRHVTSGIAIERMVEGPLRLAFRIVRVVIVVGFLVLLTVSAWRDTLSSFSTHETTIDVVQWPVWIAKAAIPVGAAFWALAELCKAVLRGNADEDAEVSAITNEDRPGA